MVSARVFGLLFTAVLLCNIGYSCKCWVHIYGGEKIFSVLFFDRNSSEHNDSFNGSITQYFHVLKEVSEKYSSCYIFIEHNIPRAILYILSQEREIMPFYASQKLTDWRDVEEIQPCIDNMHLQIYIKIVGYFPVKEIVIFTEGNRCNAEFANVLSKNLSDIYYARVIAVHITKLYNIQSNLIGTEKLFIYFGSNDILTYIFTQIKLNRLDSPNNAWVIEETMVKGDMTILPYNTIIMYHHSYWMFGPVMKMNHSSSTYPCKQNYMSTQRVITVKMWGNSQMKILFDARSSSREQVKYLLYENELERNTDKTYQRPIRMVSIIDGPFLSEISYLYNPDTRSCDSASVVCRKFNNEKNSWHFTCCFGYVAELYSTLAYHLNFRLELYNMPGMIYGGYDPVTGTFNGMIGAIMRGDFDMATPLTISEKRLTAVDFSTPYIEMETSVATKLNALKDPLFNVQFLAHLEYVAILASLGLFNFSIAIIYVYDNSVLLQRLKVDFLKRSRKVLKKYSMEESFSYVTGIMFQRDVGGKNPSTYGGRFVAIFIAFGMVALTTLYTASLTVGQVTKIYEDEFKGLQDPRMLNPSDKFPFGTVADTSTVTYFENSNNQTYRRIGEFMKKYNVKDGNVGVEKVLNGEMGAMLYDRYFLTYFIANQAACQIKLTSSDITKYSYGIAVKKRSKLTSQISEVITKLKDSRYLERLEQKWLYMNCPETNQGEFQTFELSFFGTPAIILLSIILFSLCILCIEIFYKDYYLSKRCKYNIGY